MLLSMVPQAVIHHVYYALILFNMWLSKNKFGWYFDDFTTVKSVIIADALFNFA